MTVRQVITVLAALAACSGLVVATAPASSAAVPCQPVGLLDIYPEATGDQFNVVSGGSISAGPQSPPNGNNGDGIRANDYIVDDSTDPDDLRDLDRYGSEIKYYLVNGPTKGTLSFYDDGSFRYVSSTPPDASATDSFTYYFQWLTKYTCSSTVTVTLNASPRAPIAVKDPPWNGSYEVAGNDTLTVGDPSTTTGAPTGVLANDLNTISGGNGNLYAQLTNVGSIPNTASLTWGGPSEGTSQNGSFSFTPTEATRPGYYYFYYRNCYFIRGDIGPYCSNDAVVRLRVLSTIVGEPDSFTTGKNTPLVADVAANDFNNTQTETTYSVVNQPSHGGVQFSGGGSFTYTPANEYQGYDGFSYRACATVSGLPESCSGPTNVTIRVGTPPTVTVASATAPEGLRGGAFEWSFSDPVRGWVEQGATVRLKGSTSPLPGSYQCLMNDAVVPCGSTHDFSRIRFTPSAPLTPGAHFLMRVNNPGSYLGMYLGVDPDFGLPVYRYVTSSEVEVQAQSNFADGDYPIKYSWARVKRTNALGGSFVQEQFPEASLRFAATGDAVGLVFRTGPDAGSATITIATPGEPTFSTVLDTYSARVRTKTYNFGALPAGKHTVTVKVNGWGNAKSTGTWVRLDGTVVGGVTKGSPKLTSRWAGYPPVYSYTDGNRAGVSMTFDGPTITWIAMVGPNNGIARVLVDGQVVAFEDLYAAGYTYGQEFTYGNLGAGTHTIRIEATGQRSALSSDEVVTFEGFSVG